MDLTGNIHNLATVPTVAFMAMSPLQALPKFVLRYGAPLYRDDTNLAELIQQARKRSDDLPWAEASATDGANVRNGSSADM
jgi:hypothetical protein